MSYLTWRGPQGLGALAVLLASPKAGREAGEYPAAS